MVKKLKLLCTSLLLSLLLSCEDSNSSSDIESSNNIDLSKLTASCFTANSSNPIFSSGDFFNSSHWNDPHIRSENSTYVLYISSPTSFSPNNDVGVYRFTGSDGLNFSENPSGQILAKSDSAWATKAIETPSVVLFNGTYHMFYTGYATDGSTNYKIGHATSTDGSSWTDDSSYLLEPTSFTGGAVTDFYYGITAEPGAVVFNNQIYLYFAAQGYDSDIDDQDGTPGSQVLSIGLMTSSDGVNWSTPVQAFTLDTSIWPRHDGSDEVYRGYSTPNAIVLEDRVYVFHDVVDGSGGGFNQAALSFAYSEDGETNWVQSTEAIFTKSDATWTEDEIRSPAMVLDGTDLVMWYAGTDASEASPTDAFSIFVGQAVCDLSE